MALFDMFSKEKREVAASIRDYEECYRARRARLLSFRQNALQEIPVTYPDARMLLNPLDARFMALARRTGRLLVGQFADNYYPRLDYIDVTADTSQRRAAAERFLAETSRCKGCISPAETPRLENAARWLSESTISRFQTMGYAVTGVVELENIIGGSLFLNNTLIAKSTLWEPKPSGYFSSSILKEVLGRPIHTVTSNFVRLLVVDRNAGGEGGTTNYDLTFHHSQSQSMSMRNLQEFLEEIEPHFSTLSSNLSIEDVEYNQDATQGLNLPNEDADETIESRYLLQ